MTNKNILIIIFYVYLFCYLSLDNKKMAWPETIKFDNWDYKSSIDNIKEIERVTKQTQKELNNLANSVKTSFFEKKENNSVVYDMNLVKNYLKFCTENTNFKITTPVVMAVQIALESLDEKYDVWRIDWILKLNNSSVKSNTEKAIIKFQEDNVLDKVDWIPWKETIRKILEELWRKNIASGEVTGNVTGDVTEVVTGEVTEAVTGDATEAVTEQTDIKKLLYALEIYNWRNLTEDFKQKIENDWYDVNEIISLAYDKDKMENLSRMYPTINKWQPSQTIDIAQYKKELEQINNVNNLIGSLPEASTVTVRNESQINEAKRSYDALTANQKKQVKNIQRLNDAINALNVLKQNETQRNAEIQAKIKNAKDKINALPTPTAITINHKNQIETARNAANEVIDKLDSQLISRLEAAEAALNQLNNNANETEALTRQQIQNVQQQINNLSGYRVWQEFMIKNARTSYNNLSENLRAKINLSKLEEAETWRAQHIEELISNLPNAVDVKIDDESKINEARNAYEKLYGNLHAKVGNLLHLIDAEEALQTIKAEEKARLEEEARRQREINANMGINQEITVNITPKYKDNGTHYLENRNDYLNINILQWPKLIASKEHPEQVGWIWSSMMQWFRGDIFKNMNGIVSATTRSQDRFRKPWQRGVLDEQKLKTYCETNWIKSFVLYFWWNEAANSVAAVNNAYEDIKVMGDYLNSIWVQPVLCTCIWEKRKEHSVWHSQKAYPLADTPSWELWFNSKIRKLWLDNTWPVIDFAKIDVGNVWYPGPKSDHPSLSHWYPEMRQKILDNLS